MENRMSLRRIYNAVGQNAGSRWQHQRERPAAYDRSWLAWVPLGPGGRVRDGDCVCGSRQQCSLHPLRDWDRSGGATFSKINPKTRDTALPLATFIRTAIRG